MAYTDVTAWGPQRIALVITRESTLRGTIRNVKYFNGKEWVTTIPSIYVKVENIGLRCTVKNTSLYKQRVNARCIFTFTRPDGKYIQLGASSIEELGADDSWEFFETWLPDLEGDWLGQIDLQMEEAQGTGTTFVDVAIWGPQKIAQVIAGAPSVDLGSVMSLLIVVMMMGMIVPMMGTLGGEETT